MFENILSKDEDKGGVKLPKRRANDYEWLYWILIVATIALTYFLTII